MRVFVVGGTGAIGAPLLPVLHVPSVLADGGNIGTWPCPLLVNSPDLGRRIRVVVLARPHGDSWSSSPVTSSGISGTGPARSADAAGR